ncbi:MAG: family N-acetyltransferase [Caulobacteraceae bacterium]|nr:family N-acetyltransferase [Caulobacteraceae bacterium]
MALTAPQLLGAHHRLDDFDSGVPSLDDWLRRRARANQVAGASRTFVVAEDDQVVGYFSLASGSISLMSGPGPFRRSMPDPIPVAMLARLAVARSYQGRGLGKALMSEAFRRVLMASENIGIRGMVIHAINEEARDFYMSLGFEPAINQPMTLLNTLERLRGAL